MCVRDRLKAYLKHKKISQGAFAESIGASAGYVNAISKGIGSDKIPIIRAAYPDLNIDWLLTNEGSMLKTTDQPVSQGGNDVTPPKAETNNLDTMERMKFFEALERRDQEVSRLITIIEKMQGITQGAESAAQKKEA